MTGRGTALAAADDDDVVAELELGCAPPALPSGRETGSRSRQKRAASHRAMVTFGVSTARHT